MYDTQDLDYDDVQLAQIEEQQLETMVTELVEYVIFLRDTAANLRAEVNNLSYRINHKHHLCIMNYMQTFVERLKIFLFIHVSRSNLTDLSTNRSPTFCILPEREKPLFAGAFHA